MYFAIGLGDNSELRRSRYFATVVRFLLNSLVMADRLYLRMHPNLPLLYDSGVRYRTETPAFLMTTEEQLRKRIERFDDIPTQLKRGWGDCDDLAPWRCAELRERFGEKASLKISWKKIKNEKVFHITVRREDGTVEDPSAHLGMSTPRQGKF